MNKLAFSLCGVLTFSSCVSYKPAPIERKEISKKILKELNPPEIKTSVLQFKEAVRLMSLHNKELALMKGAYRNSLKAAQVQTPLPNPEISLGLTRAFRLDEKTAGSSQPFLSVAFTIPLSGRLSLQDNLKQLAAEERLQKLITQHRGLFLKLREAFIKYSIKNKQISQQKKVISLMDQVLEANKKLVDSGFYSSLDLQRVQLEKLTQMSALIEIETEGISEKGELEKLLNKILKSEVLEEPVHIDFSVPDIREIWHAALLNNWELNDIFMQYTIAEKKLELEIRKQYPDLEIGSGLAQEPGEKKRLLSLSIGIDLPVFDRNQVEIQKALGERQLIKLKFEKKVSNIRLKLQNKLDLLRKEIFHYKHLKGNTIPKIEELLKTAEKAVEVGELSLGRYWDFKARSLEIEKELFQRKARIYTIIFELEKTVGRPLIKIFKYDHQLFDEMETEK